ncbi:glycosyltransferase family 4 protein [Mesonia sp. MT50]|uniref:Glycosyltransferase family 4 protein n=1 Tax=Mesonia profundi TaxID=3070998 RepID=A0ABU1A3K0_9FLAO|nr:glycosyltransferase family 4 protein [Mesonia profundi]MDQ7918278.1 glycosyltransferase family 4 protein [Mesonia profundi]
MKNKILLIHAWSVQKKDKEYFIPFTHLIYLNEIVNYYDSVILLSPCKVLNNNEITTYKSLNNLFNAVSVYELPEIASYFHAIKYFPKYLIAYRRLKDINTYYSRYPVPFGWLQKLYGKDSKRIVHYVGDPTDTTRNNPNFSKLKKKILLNLFRPENFLYTLAAKDAKVYTNGHHIADKLKKRSINAIPLISSTLTEKDFFFEESKNYAPNVAKFIYLGNLRSAKGVETIIRAFGMYQKEHPQSQFNLIGSGEFEDELKNIVKLEKISNVAFIGRIDDRDQINSLLRTSDVFLFGSLSEGSPRVILEAMANGLVVISTPVGSLPNIFQDGEDILFAEFNNPKLFLDKMNELGRNRKLFNFLRINSFTKIKNYTIANFVKQIFDED